MGRISENGIREPFIVSCPGAVPEGAVTDALTDFTDLFPTFLELAGKDLPSDIVLDGRSIAKVILGAATDSPRDWIMAMGGGVAVFDGERVHPAEKYAHRALRDKRYKIWLSEKGTTHLFDLLKDPGEETNLIETADPDLVSARKRLETIASTFPEKDASPRYDPTPPQPWDRQAGVTK